MRIGFVPLIDAAPLIVADACGFFREASLDVQLERQVGWANVRDKLAFGQLDAAHALLGMPLASHLPHAGFAQPLVAIMGLGAGGNAITISRQLFDAGARTALDLAALVRRLARPLVFGHVFGCSMHHYLLRDFLASARIDLDRHTRLAVIPPPQMPQHMAGGHIDGFCVGEPWNTLAEHMKLGVPLLATTDLLPDHPEKVLAVTRDSIAARPDVLVRLIRAILRGCQYASDPAHRRPLAELLARREYIAQPADVLFECLAPTRSFAGRSASRACSFDPRHTFPSRTHMHWLLAQMRRWGHVPASLALGDIASAACDATLYRRAAASLDLPVPAVDAPPMPLRHGAPFVAPASAARGGPASERAAAGRHYTTHAANRQPVKVG